MAGYQFIHIESYGREESKKQRTQTKKNLDGTFSSKEVTKEKRGNVRWIIAEAKREPGNCYHVTNPEPPKILLGNLDEVEKEANEWAESATDAQGRKLRKDAHCLLAGVISLSREQEEDWECFKEKAMEFLKEKYGDNLRCVVEHKDESHPHLHFYCLAKKDQSFDDLHDGKKAQREFKKENPQATKQEQNLAFCEAMRKLQDAFSDKVGQCFGLTRIGPKKRRLTRAEWKAEQTQAEALKQALEKKKDYKKMFKRQALKDAEVEINEAKQKGFEQGIEEAKSLGSKIGGVWTSFKDKFSKPTMRELEIEADAKKKIEEEKKKVQRAEEEQRKAKIEADNRVTAVGNQLIKQKQQLDTANKELDKEKEEKEALQKELEYYKKNSSNLPKYK